MIKIVTYFQKREKKFTAFSFILIINSNFGLETFFLRILTMFSSSEVVVLDLSDIYVTFYKALVVFADPLLEMFQECHG